MDYENFGIEDFLRDDHFVDAVKNPTPAKQLFWDNWARNHPDRRIVLDKARLVIQSYDVQHRPEPLSNREVADMIGKVNAAIFQKKTRRSMLWGFTRVQLARIAAVLLVMVIAGITYFNSHTEKARVASAGSEMLVFENRSPVSRILRLSEGSVIVLKPHSLIRYPKSFTGPTRDIALEGEGFFEVHKNPKVPFIVHAGKMITKVLGTSFTVRAFGPQKDFQVIVNTGKVLVYEQQTAPGLKNNTVTLLPHQQVSIQGPGKTLLKDTVLTQMLLATDAAKKEFTFNNTPVITVIKKLELAYHVKIVYDEQHLKELTFTASLADLPLDQKVMVICNALNARCDFSDGEIKIMTN